MPTKNTTSKTDKAPRPTLKRIAKAMSIVLVTTLAATACSGARPELAAESTAPTDPAEAQTTPPTTATLQPTTTEMSAESASPVRAISSVETLRVVAEPGSDEIVALLGAQTDFGSARVLLVEETAGEWVRVQLPVRPNGTTGWVRADDVTLEAIDALVEVDLAARTITTWIDGEVLIETAVAVGSAENPTPTGAFFITDKVETTDEGGAYGPFALGLSAHSDTLTEFAGGEGQIGIHGTNAPESIGEAVSHGCVRLPNELIEVLAGELPLGTPVIIR